MPDNPDKSNLAIEVPATIEEIKPDKTYLLAISDPVTEPNDVYYVIGSELKEIVKKRKEVLKKIIPKKDLDELSNRELSEEKKKEIAQLSVDAGYRVLEMTMMARELEYYGDY